MRFEIVALRLRQALQPQLADGHGAGALDVRGDALRVTHGGRGGDVLQIGQGLRHRHQALRAGELPLVEGLIAEIEEVHHRERGVEEFAQRQPRAENVAALHQAVVVVLPGLRHAGRAGGQFFLADVLRVTGQERIADGREFTQAVLKHLAAGAGGEEVLLYAHPFHGRLRRAGAADVIAVKVRGAHDARALRALAAVQPREAKEFPGQLAVGRLKLFAVALEVLVREPDAEAGAEVVVAGDLVVQAQALRALAGEAGGGAGHDLGEAGLQRGSAALKVKPS